MISLGNRGKAIIKERALENIKQLTESLNEDVSSKIETLVRKSKQLIKSCNEIGKSWSGSFAGWHGQLYFKDFEEPSHQERFSVEWGGIRGIPNGWENKQTEEVKKEIEKNISGDFSIDDLKKKEAALKKKAEATLSEVKIAFSSVNLTGMEKEEGLLEEIEEFKFGKGKNYFINKMIPKSIMTRDQGALMEGICIPVHTYYLGVAQGIIDTCNSINKFLQLTDRLVRQVQIKKTQPFLRPSNAWNWVNPFWLICQLFLVLLNLTKWAWKHKIIFILITILTFLAIDYSLAWKNLRSILEWFQSLWH